MCRYLCCNPWYQWLTDEISTSKLATIKKTLSNILNRLGFRLRRVQKAKPLKKVSETDAIFDNLGEINTASDRREDSLRIASDTKAKVDLCDSSRGDTSRCRKAVKTDDHDGLKTSWPLLVF